MPDIRKILNAGYNNVAPEAGKVLLSMPFTDDAYFQRAAILMVEHNEEGSLGFVLDKALQRPVGFLLEEIKDFDAPLFVGGPVEQDRLNFLHNKGEMIENAIPIIPNLWLGGDIYQTLELIQAGMITPQDIRFFIGYSGWDDGQLENELKRNTWVVSSLTSEDIFREPYNKLWQLGLKQLGEDYAYWEMLPPNPEMN